MQIVDVETFPVNDLGSRRVLKEGEKPMSGKGAYWEPLLKVGLPRRDGECAVLVRIRTDDGITGIGESLARDAPLATAHIVDHLFKPILMGQDPFDVEILWERMFNISRRVGHSRGYFFEALAGPDCALWDIMGKAKNLPVHKLLGGCGREKIKAYASSLSFQSPEEAAKEAVRIVEAGHKMMKLKVGLGIYTVGVDKDADIQNVKAIRDAVGYDIDLLLDADTIYTPYQAIKAGRKFEKYECFFLEEPVPSDNLDGYVEVAKALDMPVCGGETHFSLYDFRDLMAKGGVDMINPDMARTGGITNTKKIVALAEAFEVGVTPHTGASSAGSKAVGMQLCATIPEKIFVAYEYMYKPRRMASEIVKGNVDEFKDGYCTLSNKPGLGIELNEEALPKYLMKR